MRSTSTPYREMATDGDIPWLRRERISTSSWEQVRRQQIYYSLRRSHMFLQPNEIPHLPAYQTYHLCLRGTIVHIAIRLFSHSRPNNLRLGFIKNDKVSMEIGHTLVRLLGIEKMSQLFKLVNDCVKIAQQKNGGRTTRSHVIVARPILSSLHEMHSNIGLRAFNS